MYRLFSIEETGVSFGPVKAAGAGLHGCSILAVNFIQGVKLQIDNFFRLHLHFFSSINSSVKFYARVCTFFLSGCEKT